VLFILLFYLTCVSADCIWYGIGDHKDPVHPHYTFYEGRGRPLNDADAYQVLSKMCPTYALGPDTPLCCDKEQLNFFHESAKPAYELFRRCPSCWANFRMLLCAMTCDPNQAEFLTPTMVVGKLVFSVQYNLTKSFADSFFNSCKVGNVGL
ncbi:hypothetical protein P879_10245, partial [Paragonimus westermani]